MVTPAKKTNSYGVILNNFFTLCRINIIPNQSQNLGYSIHLKFLHYCFSSSEINLSKYNLSYVQPKSKINYNVKLQDMLHASALFIFHSEGYNVSIPIIMSISLLNYINVGS